jgi:hypothetical protein
LHQALEEEIKTDLDDIIDEWESFKDEAHYDGVGYTWATLVREVNALGGKVNGIIENAEGSYDVTNAKILEWIETAGNGQYIANALMQTDYIFADEDRNVLKWLASGFKTSSSKYESVSQMFSAGGGDDVEGNPTASVYSKIKTVDDKITSISAGLSAMFGEATGGVYTKADFDGAVTTMFS